MCFVYRLEYLYFVYDIGGNLSIMTHLAKRVDDGSVFKKFKIKKEENPGVNAQFPTLHHN